MSKRALLWSIAGATVAFFYLAASYSGPGPCTTLNFTQWGKRFYLEDITPISEGPTGRCELLPRVAVLLIGLVASLVLVYFAEKGRDRGMNRGTKHHRLLVQDQDEDEPALYWCQDCEFESGDVKEADRHVERRFEPEPTATPLQPKAYGFGSTAPTKPEPTVGNGAAGEKTCPDCAEQVRAAARKCRFCGYRFDQNVEVDARRT